MKATVLSSIKILLLLILLLCIESACGGFVYMIYALCTTLVAGKEIHLISGMLFVKGVFLFAPVAIATSGAFLLFYLIRHRLGRKTDFFVYAIWYVMSWLILIPFSLRAYEKLNKEEHIITSENLVSPGYFRDSLIENQTVYYSQIREDASAEGISLTNRKLSTFNNKKVPQNNSVFTDPIIQKSLEMNPVISFMVKSYEKMFMIATESSRDFLAWLTFSSMGLVCLACFGLRRLSAWRLINVFLIILIFIGIFNLNLYIYTWHILPEINKELNRLLHFIPGNVFVLCVNLFIAFILFLFGLFISSYRKKKDLSDSGSIFYGADE